MVRTVLTIGKKLADPCAKPQEFGMKEEKMK